MAYVKFSTPINMDTIQTSYGYVLVVNNNQIVLSDGYNSIYYYGSFVYSNNQVAGRRVADGDPAEWDRGSRAGSALPGRAVNVFAAMSETKMTSVADVFFRFSIGPPPRTLPIDAFATRIASNHPTIKSAR
jgi:hypothetical protein